MKKIISLLCVGTMILSLAACSSNTGNDYSGQTLIGKVTAIDGNVVTVQLGELTEQQGMPNGETPPNKSDGQDGDNQMPPEKPEDSTDTSAIQETSSEESDQSTGSQSAQLDKPAGKSESSASNGNIPPEQDSNSNGTPPDGKPGDSSFTASDETAQFDLSTATVKKENDTAQYRVLDIKTDDILEITIGNNNKVTTVTIKPEDMGSFGGNFGGSSEVTQGTAANTINRDGEYDNCTYASSGDDENALRVDGATVMLNSIKINKTAGATSNTESGDFYGMNAALLATNGAQVTIKNATVTSSAQNGNGVFSYGSDTMVNISDSTITTTADNSGGIQTTGGGTTNASNLTVNTSGNSSAAIRSDRGGGTVNVDGGSYTSNGYNSPAVYSTADITAKNATLNANNSEALVIEGKNSITLENCTVSGNMSDTKGTSSDENVHNVMIYQSMSGDADVGTSSFTMTGGKLTSNNGDMFYITNTNAVIRLTNVDIENLETDGYLMQVCGNSASRGWGKVGSNGAQVEFTADGQTLIGNIAVDSISTLNMTLSEDSTFTGTVNIVDNEQSGSAVENNAVVTVDSGCTWTLTGNCKITSLTNNGTINFNGYTITLADGTILK